MYRYADALAIKEELAQGRVFSPAITAPQFSSKVGRLWELEHERRELKRDIELTMIAVAPKKVLRKEGVPGHRRNSWIDDLVDE